MYTNLQIVNSLDEKVWHDFVDWHPHGNIFHTPEMFQVFGRAKGYRPILWAAVDKHGQILALLSPVQVSLRDGLLRRLTTRSIAYGSVLCNQTPCGQEALASLLSTYLQTTRWQALYTELRNMSDVACLQKIFEKNGFVYTDHMNFLIDINCSPEQVLQNIGARTRKHIRRGLRKGNVIVELLRERSKLSIWYELVRKTYQNARVPLADRSLFEAAHEILQPRGMIQFWLARLDSTYVAASAELLYKDIIYGWYGGVDRNYAAEMPGEMLMWHILEWGAQNGYRTYDFGGAGKPNEEYGVRDFKAKFGGKLVYFGRNIHVHSPLLLRLCTLGYQFLSYRFRLGHRLLDPLNRVTENIQHNLLFPKRENTNGE